MGILVIARDTYIDECDGHRCAVKAIAWVGQVYLLEVECFNQNAIASALFFNPFDR
jgi:hypothetical protein